jgi:hypothetical protein
LKNYKAGDFCKWNIRSAEGAESAGRSTIQNFAEENVVRINPSETFTIVPLPINLPRMKGANVADTEAAQVSLVPAAGAVIGGQWQSDYESLSTLPAIREAPSYNKYNSEKRFRSI